MIKKIRSKLSIKVFLITLLLMVTCCTVTYSCIVRFSPYIYTHKLSDVEEIAGIISTELSHAPIDEAKYFILGFNDMFAREYSDEFVIHIFKSSGEEMTLPDLDSFIGTHIDDYKNEETTNKYKIVFADSTDEYILFLTKNKKRKVRLLKHCKNRCLF